MTVIVNFAIVAHNPGVGVKVYSVVAILFKAGPQVPVIPLVDVKGNGAIAFPSQIGCTALNVGSTFGFTVTDLVVEVSLHPPVPVIVYFISIVPLETPVTNPFIAFTVAIAVFKDDHLPPVTVD